jgi:LPXTG-motif cell wall-anchored protein
METSYLLIAGIAILAAVLYLVLRKKSAKGKSIQLLKYAMLTAGVVYLSIDFYQKEKYVLMVVVIVGSLAFYKLIKES